jgi:FKBP-type peptidyl-prolyl cis-trans isomerase
MRSIIILAVALVPWAAPAEDSPALQTQKERISYALGMDLGNQLRKMSVDVDPAIFGQALRDALSGGKTLLTEDQVKTAISELQVEMKRKEAARRKGTEEDDNIEAGIAAAYNKKASETFLAGNKKNEGVAALPSGLQYKILTEGSGRKPAEDDTVVCQYRGTFIDGTEFDSSYRTGQPVTVAVKGVILGWREALKLMAVGSKYQLFIPPQLAFGEQGSGRGIGPNTTLIYEIELLAIK